MEFSFSDAIFGIPDPSSHENLRLQKPCCHSTNSYQDYHNQQENLNVFDIDHSSPSSASCTNSNDEFPLPYRSMSLPDSEDEMGPFSNRSRIPVPGLVPLSRYHMWLETSFMFRRNERERQRVRNVNDGFSRLRNHLPRLASMKRRQSKVETLQHAIKYIKHLQGLLDETKESDMASSQT